MKQKEQKVPLIVRGALGAAAGISATFIAHPCDVLRVQLQLRPSMQISLLAKQLYAEAGVRGLYAGISAAWLRQIMYGAPRLGIYSYLYENFCDSSATPPFLTKLALGLTAGSLGALCGTPAELALVRMSADAGLPVARQRNYRNALDCIARVTREEGALVLWRGCTPTVARAALVNMGQLGFYSEFGTFILAVGAWYGDRHKRCRLILAFI